MYQYLLDAIRGFFTAAADDMSAHKLFAAITAVTGVAFFSFVEYCLHRYVMHKPLALWGHAIYRYPFVRHAQVHHVVFKANHTYHANDKNKGTIPMAWWNGAVLVVLGSIPGMLLAHMTGHPLIALISFIVGGIYYGLYEWMHWCMHLPRPRRWMHELRLAGWIFYKLNGHHLLHHAYMGSNFNVVLPMWDLIFGTLVRRFRTEYPQARGLWLPDLQPRKRHQEEMKLAA